MSVQPSPEAFAHAQPVLGPLTYSPRPAAGREAEALVRRHLPLVRRLAWHVHGAMSTLVDVEDLVQVGLIALVEAASGGASEDRGAVAYRQYLVTRIRGAMIDELRRQATTTRGAMRRRRALAEATKMLTHETGRAPDETAVAAKLGLKARLVQ